MNGLILFAFLGVGLFLTFLVMALRGAPKPAPDSVSLTAVKQMVGLEGLPFAQFELLMDDSDYEILRSNPDLHRIANDLRNERRKLAMLWIEMLLNDLRKLWRFRRFLVRRGVSAGFGEELRIFHAFLLSLLLLHLAKFFIRCFGPFALPRMARRAQGLVETMSYAPAYVLSRIPAASWSEIQHSWASSTV